MSYNCIIAFLCIVHSTSLLYFPFCLVHRLVVALSVTLGLFAIELAGFFSGASMFNNNQGLLCILSHNVIISIYQFVFRRQHKPVMIDHAASSAIVFILIRWFDEPSCPVEWDRTSSWREMFYHRIVISQKNLFDLFFFRWTCGSKACYKIFPNALQIRQAHSLQGSSIQPCTFLSVNSTHALVHLSRI